MTACDFLVCGGGIAGASVAARLASHAKVIIAEQESVAGYHTTGRSAAMYILSYGDPAVRRLTAASRDFFDAPPAGFADYPLLSPRGCLTIARTEQLDELQALADSLTAFEASFSRLDGEGARALVPPLRADAVAAAVYESASFDIDVGALHQGFLRLAKARGAELVLDGGIVSLRAQSGGGWRATLANGETIEAGVVVNAAGAWADTLAGLAGLAPLGLTPKRRTAILLDPPPGVSIDAWPNVIDVAEQFYFKPQSGLILASPADETPSPPLDAAAEELDIAVCVDRIQAVADIPVRHIARAWAGLRTFAPDLTPVIGYDPRTEGFFWCAGQGGYGMQTSPAASELAAALALNQAIPPGLAAHDVAAADYSPARF
ncbi:MAG TPA: FAD-binding oxidoreductase [Caulobacteraceae bacterium]|jgi:D-arginine dehydrogenase|nr:FAD-binding oxidoreductase [Caulobacteraceae bacterium]